VLQQLEQRFDVADARDVVDAAGPVGEDGRGEDRERRVLVAGGPDGPGEGAPTGHAEEGGHKRPT
jgi:hypothetical protein